MNDTVLNVTATTLGAIASGNAGAGSMSALAKIGFKNPLYILAGVPVMVFLLWYMRRGGKLLAKKRILFLLVRFIVTALISIALAGPVWIETTKTIEEMPPITVLVDSSGSMAMFNGSRSLGQGVYADLKGMVGNVTGRSDNVELEFFSEGNRTSIGDTLYYNMLKAEGKRNILVLESDGNSNYGRNPIDVAKALAQSNATVYAVRPGKPGKDVYISDVIGDRKIPSNAEYQLLIVVGNTGFLGVSYDLNVYTDGVRKFGKRMTQNEVEKTIELQLALEETGVHVIKVEIIPPEEDSIQSNNVFYKTVEVVEKPRILVVTNTSTSPLTAVLKRLYNVDETLRPQADYGSYTAVVLDNVPSNQLDRNTVTKLRQYVLNGNGLAVVGGKHSFEYGGYNSSFIETLLPVLSTDKPRDRRKEIAVVFVIDRSGSQMERMRGAKDSSIDVAKAITVNLMRKLADNDSVGVIAFDTTPHDVSPISPLGPKKTSLQDTVLRLAAASRDGTDPRTSIERAREWLRPYTNDKYIIFMSDGQYSASTLPTINSQGEALRQEKIKVYVVGVGSVVMDYFLAPLAEKSGGTYFRPEAYERLKLEFGENRKEDDSEILRLSVRDDTHFITRGVNLDETTISGNNKVYDKTASQLLITSRGGQPVLTVWHFGLGRVAALTTDNGNVWATGYSGLYGAFKGKVLSGMINWVIGDLEKGRKVNIRAEDLNLGGSVEIGVKAQSQPALTVKDMTTDLVSSVSMVRTGQEQYFGTFTPEKTGFFGLRATAGADQDLDAVAVNYPVEYSQLGVNEGVLGGVSGVTGGKVYDASEIKLLEQDLIDHAKTISTQEIAHETALWMYFAACALTIYFIDVIARRLAVIFRKRDEY